MIQREKTSIKFKSKRILGLKEELRYLDFVYKAADTCIKEKDRFINFPTPASNDIIVTKPEKTRKFTKKEMFKSAEMNLFLSQIFQRLKQEVKLYVKDEELLRKKEIEAKAERKKKKNIQNMHKTVRDHDKLMFYQENYNQDIHRRTGIKMLEDIVEAVKNKDTPKNRTDSGNTGSLSPDHLNLLKSGLGSPALSARVTNMNSDMIAVTQLDSKQKMKDTDGNLEDIRKLEGISASEEVRMVQETLHEFIEKQKKLKLLKQRLAGLEKGRRDKKADVYAKVLGRIYEKNKCLGEESGIGSGVLNFSPKLLATEQMRHEENVANGRKGSIKQHDPIKTGSREDSEEDKYSSAVSETSQHNQDNKKPEVDNKISDPQDFLKAKSHVYSTKILTINDEVERVLLISQREKEESKKKLLKAKALVNAA
mmetsp:Transcript_38241/g.37753  ORF Transcript_38241/g.37753 Transcript_38241/m.37753 type:complete len:424 (+) Transcript_38241:303-1574(+)